MPCTFFKSSKRLKMNNGDQEQREKALRDAKMYMANDWEIKEETPEYFLLTRSNATKTKHLVLAFFTIWWTFGIANPGQHASNF